MADGPFTRKQINELADSLSKLLRTMASGQPAPPCGTHTQLTQAAEALEAIVGSGRAAEQLQQPVDEGPVRVARMQVHRREGAPAGEGEVYFRADLEPAPAQDARRWWMTQLHRQVSGVRGSSGGTDRFYFHVQAALDQLETVARQLVVAVEEANTALEHHEEDRHVRSEHLAVDDTHNDGEMAEKQAILNRVMDEYRSRGGGDSHGRPSPAK